MPRKPKTRQCQRCGTVNEGSFTLCKSCGNALVKRRFKMTFDKIKLVKTLANRKGLIIGGDDELYKLRLGAIGLNSCKDFKKQSDFNLFIKQLKNLPDKRA